MLLESQTPAVVAAVVPAGPPAAAADSSSPAEDRLHLVSWNVAGLKTTLDNIRRFKGGFQVFLERHHVDVLCLQEVKLSSKTIAADGTKLGIEVAGFESFWACNEGAGAQRQGLNGVATFARNGTVLRADSEPLGDPELDKEGRCLLTDHGAFVVFNVYVPNTAGGPRLPYKLRFLRALRAAMQRERAAGRPVILAGDLNMKARSTDIHWSLRPLDLRALAARLPTPFGDPNSLGPVADALSPEGRSVAESIVAAWPGVMQALRARELRPFETKNSRNGQTFLRWGVFAKSASGEMVRVGPPFENEDCARTAYQVDGAGVESDGTVVFGPAAADAAFALQPPGRLSVGDVAECLRRIASIELTPRALGEVATVFGRVPLAPPAAEWLEAAMREDGMVDSFAELHPTAEERFTCWDQYKNKRHENVGGRIDYILVDRGFFDRHAMRGDDLAAYGPRSPESREAALAAATLGGLSQPAGFAGGGMPTLDEEEYFAQFRLELGTGMLYTPPQLSDHIPVTLLLRGLPPQTLSAPTPPRDAATLKCQPHRTAKRITDFFSRKTPTAPATAQVAPPAKRVARGAA